MTKNQLEQIITHPNSIILNNQNKNPFSLRGVVYTNSRRYTQEEQLHLIDFLASHNGNLFIWTKFSWSNAYSKFNKENEHKLDLILEKCQNNNIQLWVGFKPGDSRYCQNYNDRKKLIHKAKYCVKSGASIYLAMDDTHPKQRIVNKDGIYQGMLIKELSSEIGINLKGICAEEYYGQTMNHTEYWENILQHLPLHTSITWCGKRIWNKQINKDHFPQTEHPLLLWDNFFASDQDSPQKAPIYPYSGRDKNLQEKIQGIIINPNPHYAWQFTALHTALDFMNAPQQYNPTKSFKTAIMELGDNYLKSLKKENNQKK